MTSQVLSSAPPLRTPIPDKTKETTPRLAFPKLDHQHHHSRLAIKFRSIRSVKGYIIIDHYAPIICPICHEVFGSVTYRDQHISARTCAKREMAVDLLVGANEDQVKKFMLRGIYRGIQRERPLISGVSFACGILYFLVNRVVYPASAKELEAVALSTRMGQGCRA